MGGHVLLYKLSKKILGKMQPPIVIPILIPIALFNDFLITTYSPHTYVENINTLH